MVQNRSKQKTASICVNPKDNYLFYRYGARSHIQLTYPAEASSSPWKNFSFNSYVIARSDTNDPKGEYGISFTNNDYEAGIIITHKGGDCKILGMPQTQKGSLARLEKFKSILNYQ